MAYGQFIYSEGFTGTDAAGWIGVQDGSYPGPRLTAGAVPTPEDPEYGAPEIDTVGNGWMRLATTTGNQANAVTLNTEVPSAGDTVTMTFDFTMWDTNTGTPADGLSVFAYDASQNGPFSTNGTFTTGGYGGSLAYAMRDGTVNGMPGGYFGVGVDTFGNFLNNLENRTGYPNGTNPEGNNSLLPNEIGLRGPGSGQTGYYVLAGTGINNYTAGNVAIASLNATTQNLQFPTYTTRPDQDAEDFRSMSVVLAPNNTVSVYLQVGYTGNMSLLFSANLTGYGTRPSELGFGFGASTGGDDEVIEIRNVLVTSSGSANTWYWSNQDPSVPEQWNDTSTLNWIGNNTVPGIGAGEYGTVAFNNTNNLTGNYQVNISGTPKTVGSISFSGNGSYNVTSNITGAAIDFNTNGNGPSIISNLNNPNGNANQTIAANMALTGNNALAVQNYVSTTLTLSGNLNMNAQNASYDTTGNIVDSGAISGTGNVTIGDSSGAGPGLVTFSGNNSYTGSTTIDTNATLVAASANALGGTGNGTTITNGGALGLQGNVTFAAEPLSINGTGGPIYDSGALVNVSGNNTWTGNITMAGNSTVGAEAGSLTISGPIASAAGGNYGLTFDVDSGATLTDSANITGNTSTTITKTDGGTAILSGNNSTTGNAFVNAGVLQVNGNSSLGNGAATTVSANATLALGGTGATYLGKTVTLNGQGATGDAALWNAAGNNTWGNSTVGNVTLGSDSSIGAASNTTLTVNSTLVAGTSNITFGGGNGTVLINQAISSTGNVSNVTISSGTLTANGSNLLVGNSTLKVASGGTLNMTAGNEIVGALSGAGAISLGTRTFTFGAGNLSTTYSGSITSTNSTVGTIVQNGTGNLTLSGSAGAVSANTYKLSSGELILGSANVISSTTDLNLAGGTLDMNGMQDIFGNLTLSANSVVDYQGLTGGNLAAAVSGTIVAPAANLTVNNWAGGYTNIAGGTVIGGNNTLLYFSNVTNTTNLNTLAADTSFAGWGNGTLINLTGNNYEIVPLLAGSNDFYWRGNGGSIWGNTTWTLGNGTASVGPNAAGTVAIFGDTDGSGHAVTNTTVQMSSGRTVGSMIFTESSAADAYKIQSSNTTTETLTLQGNGTSNAFITASGNQTNVIGSNSTDRVNITLASNLTIQNNDTNAAGLTLGNTSGTTETFTNGGCTTTVTGTGNTVIDMTMSGTGGLIDSSTGNLVLNEASTYTGNTTLNSGFLQLGNNNAVGNGTSNLTINGGTLGAIGGSRTAANAYFVDGNFTIGNVDGSNLTLSGNGVLAAGSETLTVSSGIGATLSGVLSGSGNLTSAGPGNLTITNGNNTFNGNFGVAGGNVFVGVGNTSAAGNSSLGLTLGATSAGQNELGTGNVSVTGGELQFAPNTSFNGTTTLASGSSLTVNGTGVINLTNGNTGTNDNVVDNGTVSYSSTGNSTIHDNGTFTMNTGANLTISAGTLNLTPNGNFTTNGSNTSGVVNITDTSGGNLNINTSGGSGSFTLGANDSLTSNGTGTNVNITTASTSQINFNGTVVVSNGGQVVVSSNNTVLGGGPVLLNGGNASTAGTLVVQSGNLTINADSSHALANAPNVQFNGVSTLFGGSANTSITNFGTVTINHGTLTLDAATVDNVQGSGIVIVNGGTLISGASNQIENNTGMTLNSGTWKTQGNSEVLGTLTLSASSTLNLGNGTSVINYANSSGQTWVTGGTGGAGLLYVTNWSGNASGGGIDQLIFGSSNTSLTAAQLNQIKFVDPFNTGNTSLLYSATILSDGEVVPSIPFAAVPEPGTYAGGGSLVVLAAWWEWRRRRLAAGQRWLG